MIYFFLTSCIITTKFAIFNVFSSHVSTCKTCYKYSHRIFYVIFHKKCKLFILLYWKECENYTIIFLRMYLLMHFKCRNYQSNIKIWNEQSRNSCVKYQRMGSCLWAKSILLAIWLRIHCQIQMKHSLAERTTLSVFTIFMFDSLERINNG